jgi:signal transduction histidine kinase/ActR/RegA family two-component response regulator
MAVITEHLEKDGYYEYQVRGHYTGKPDEFMYRRLQYYYLDDTHDTILVVQSDVTNAVLQQKKENAYVADILDSVSTGIVSFRMPDPDHLEGVFVNYQMFRILGMEKPEGADTRKALMSDPLIDAYVKDAFTAVYPDDLARVRKAFRDGYDKEYFSAGNYRILKRDGSPVWINQDAILREIRPDGRIFYASYRVAEHEVALQAQLERQLEEEKSLREEADFANSAKSDFLSRMSHDMRTPLNGIIGMTYLTQEMELPEQAKENLQKIDVSSKFLLSLINNVLDMSKAESGEIELHPEPYPIDEFNKYLDAVVRPLCQEKEQKFVLNEKFAIADFVPLSDKLRCNQIMFNLLSNAVKYTPEGGTITYTIRGRLLESGKMQIEHEIADNGIGMSEKFQKILFDPFTQENRKDTSERRGTGLGLAIVKKLVDQMGGTIVVHSIMGKGTTFLVTLLFDTVPTSSLASSSGNNTRTVSQMISLAGKHVLLCEDHPLNQEIAKTLLSEKQVIVSIASDGKMGVDMFRESSPGFYDAVLMDIRMPVMNGYEATRAIRALKRSDAKTVPIIAMTADALTDDIQKCLQIGMNGHIAKPVDPETMYAVLSGALKGRA